MFWGLVFVFLYVLYVYDDSVGHFGVLEKGYDGIKGFDDLGQILRSRIVRDFNENMTWINMVFGSVIGCVTKSSCKTSCRPTELAVRPTTAAALSEGRSGSAGAFSEGAQRRSAQRRSEGAQRRSAQRRSEGAQRRSAQRRSEGARRRSAQRRSEGARRRSAQRRSEGAQQRSAQRRSEGAFNEGALSQGAPCRSAQRCSVL